MKNVRTICLVTALFASSALAQTSAPATSLPAQDAATPAPKMDAKTGKENGRFMQMHEKFVQQAKAGDVDLLFLGDSITEGWGGKGKDVWQKHYADKYKVANFGIGGDRTQHVLWRIENGELDGIKPKLIVLMIGTNNTSSDPADRIEKGIEEIVQTCKDKTGAKILLLAVFPRGENETKPEWAHARAKIREINKEIAKLDDGGKTVKYMDLWDKFVNSDGELPKEIMPDSLHPNDKGYQIWAEAIDPVVAEMMGQK